MQNTSAILTTDGATEPARPSLSTTERSAHAPVTGERLHFEYEVSMGVVPHLARAHWEFLQSALRAAWERAAAAVHAHYAAQMVDLREELAKAEAECARLRALVAGFTDEGICELDHHGYCQTHGWFMTEPACPHARARALLGITPRAAQPAGNKTEVAK